MTVPGPVVSLRAQVPPATGRKPVTTLTPLLLQATDPSPV